MVILKLLASSTLLVLDNWVKTVVQETHAASRKAKSSFLDLLYEQSKSLAREQMKDLVRFVTMLPVGMDLNFGARVDEG